MAGPNDYGWSAVPRSHKIFLQSTLGAPDPPQPLNVADIHLPTTSIVQKVLAYATSELPVPTYNHSMRVFYYGQALIHQYLPQFSQFTETFLLACLLHDIGTTPASLRSTRLSFEFHGALLALNLLASNGAPKAQAESVAEAIIRHQDVGESGMITSLGLVIQLVTLWDNMGVEYLRGLIHEETVKSVTHAFPRQEWSRCFASVIREEVCIKPWCHTTSIDGFAERVEGNKVMEPYELERLFK